MQTEKVIELIVKWLDDYQQSSRSKGFVIGVSGGIDSAVVSTLCARTGRPVLVLEMPIRQSSKEVQRSSAHIQWLKTHFKNVTGAEVNLTEVFDTFEKTVKKSEVNETNAATEIALANMRSRLRMVSRKLPPSSISLSPRRTTLSGQSVLLRLAQRLPRGGHGQQSGRLRRWFLHQIR